MCACVHLARRYERHREGPVQLEWDISGQFDVAREKKEIVVFRERRSHSADRKQRIPNSFQTRSPEFLVSDSTKPEVTAGLRSIAKTLGPEGEPAGIQARNPREDGIKKGKGDLLNICKDQVSYLSLCPFIK